MNFRSELFQPELLWRDRRAVWDEGGQKDLATRAEERATELMGNTVENGLDEKQKAELEKIAGRLSQNA